MPASVIIRLCAAGPAIRIMLQPMTGYTKFMQKIKLLIFFCLLSFSVAFAQDNTTTSSVYQYTTENGLPSNLIRGLQWDESTHFLWVITEGGIVRMNGVDFKSYNKEKISPLAPEKSLYAVKNNAGTIFISDGSGKIYEIQKNKPVLSKPASLSSSFINYHFISVSDTFFAAKIKTAPAFDAPFEKVICLSDTSCLVLFQNTLYFYSLQQHRPVAIPFKPNAISAVFKIQQHCFVVDNNRQVFLLNSGTLTATPVDFGADKELLNFNNGTSQLFWKTGMPQPIIITANTAWLITYVNGNMAATRITSMIPKDANISSVEYADKNRMLFIGTESKGVIIINENLVQPKKRKNANPKNKNAYFSQLALDNGNILTNEGDIIGNSNSPAGQLPIPGKFATRISLTNNGNLVWYNAPDAILGYNCLHQFNKATGKTTTFSKIKINTQVEISGGITYLANNKGIGILQADSIGYLYEYPKTSTNLNTYDFKEIKPGILAIAGCGGLLRFTTATHTLDTIYSRENACFGSIWKYKDYIFWGSYGFGYYVYKDGVIKEMPIDKNEYLLYCHCFVPDPYGFCWISTNRGLFKVELDEIIAHFENGNTPVYYHYFGKKDGIEMTELNGGCTPCALTLKDATISFPTMDGLLWVNPSTANPVLPSGAIFIDEVLIDNKSIHPDSLKGITLGATVQEIIFKLGFAAWCNKENLYIDYQLNDTSHWKKLKTDDNINIQFNNLPAGRYILRIRKLNGFGINNYAYKTIEFTIAKRWYNEWWFYLLLLAGLTGMVSLFGKIRNRQFKIRQKKLEQQVAEKTQELMQKNEVLEKNNSIKTRLISIISHDIVTPLKFLTVAGKNLLEKRKVMPEELQQETIKEITNTSQELQLLSTNILNWIKYQNENRRLAKEQFNLYEMVNQVLGVLNSLAKQKQIRLLNNISHHQVLYQYFEPLKILIYNLISNAINFSEKGIIEINCSAAPDYIILTVKDEGVGMTRDQIQNIMADQFIISSANIDNRKGNGLGYLIIKDLLKTMGASLYIKSEKGVGTTVTVHIPVADSNKAD